MPCIIKQKIIHFFFNSTRKKCKIEMQKISDILNDILYNLKGLLYNCDDIIEIDVYISYFILLYKLIVYTRDIDAGKGERDLTYMMIDIWYNYFPELAENILETIPENYGSWKDLKYFCKYTKNENARNYCIRIWNNQLEKDILNYGKDKEISLVSKWIPREKSTFGWLFEKSAMEWYYRINTDIHQNSNIIKKEYRLLLSFLNEKLDTPQIKETQGKWSKIIPEEISLSTKSKQYNTFINVNNLLELERIKCKNNFEFYYNNYNEKKDVNEDKKNKRCKSFHLREYCKNPHMQNEKYWNEIKKDILYSSEINEKRYLLPVVNISITEFDEYLDAISIGCMISEISTIKNRMIIYDKYAHWINFTNCNLETKIKKIKEKTILKGHSNILSVIELLKNTKQDLTELILVIISDYSIEPNDLDAKITEKIDKYPLKIIYWNVGSKITPIQYSKNNILISGCSSSILKNIYQNLEMFTDTYSFINNIVNHPKYIKVEEYFKQKIMNE